MKFTDDEFDADFKGLYGDVVTEDVYRLKQLDSAPDVIFDLGANVGIFTRYAAELFPHAMIHAVEPNLENYRRLVTGTLQLSNVTTTNAAIGNLRVWRAKGAVNGAHECYPSPGLGYAAEDFCNDGFEDGRVSTLLLDVLEKWSSSWPNAKTFWKIDVEGAENCIFIHKPSCEVLAKADNIAMELHFHSAHGGQQKEVRDATFQWMADMWPTHHLELEHVMLYARKRQ